MEFILFLEKLFEYIIEHFDGGEMNDSWDTRRKALEDDYFLKKNQEALSRIQERQEEEQSSKGKREPLKIYEVVDSFLSKKTNKECCFAEVQSL